MLLAPLKQNYGNEAELYRKRIVAQAYLLFYIGDVKITPVDYYKFILQFGSLSFESSLAFVI